mgnify:CR=1 FL=1
MKDVIRKTIDFLNLLFNKALLKYRKVKIGKNLRISGRLFCITNAKHHIILGNDVKINSCRGANPIGGDTKTILFAKGDGKIVIGDNVGISNSTIFSCENITIENNVLIGGNTKIYDTDFHWIDYDKRVIENGGATKPVIIKEGAFIGAHCIILKGVSIGERAIVGAGSVVTKDIPALEIWAGNPACFIRSIANDSQ